MSKIKPNVTMTVFGITDDGFRFYDARRDDWFEGPQPDGLYTNMIQARNALKIAEQTHPRAEIVDLKISPV